MTKQQLKLIKPGDKVVFKYGLFRGMKATIIAIDPPDDIIGKAKIKYKIDQEYGLSPIQGDTTYDRIMPLGKNL